MSLGALINEIEKRCVKFQFEDAELLADILCSQDETSEIGSYIYGRVLVQQFKYGPAIQYLSRCRSPKSYYFLALSYLATSEWEKSLSTIETLRGCRNEPLDYPDFMGFELSEADVLKLKGRILEAMGDAQAAFVCFSSAVKRDELSVYSHYRRYKLEPLSGFSESLHVDAEGKRQQKRKKSSQSPKKSIRDDPFDHFRDNLGSCLIRWGITRLDSLFLKTVSASDLYEQGKFVEARRAFFQVLSLDPYYDGELMEQLPLILWKLGDDVALKKLIKSWVGVNSLRYLSLIAKGNLFSLEGDRKASIAAFLEAADFDPKRPLPFVLIGFEFLILEDFPAAKAHFLLALRRNSLSSRAMLGLGVICYRQNDLPNAEAFFSSAARLLPSNHIPHTYLANICMKIPGRMDEAMQHVENALRLDPANAKALYIKSCILAGIGKTKDAIDMLKGLVELAPLEPEALVKLGELYLSAGNSTASLRAFAAANDLDPNIPRVIDAFDKFSKMM